MVCQGGGDSAQAFRTEEDTIEGALEGTCLTYGSLEPGERGHISQQVFVLCSYSTAQGLVHYSMHCKKPQATERGGHDL